ncbi:hypothetical protein [Streptomyces sp. DH1]|uniref:hypothetical protein n=1 Tax=Streptomyces sp. DH1 TaxID=2857012 RepID=UPI001E2EE231|nr:hypothetical protein [Streptomyces sp. DH1]
MDTEFLDIFRHSDGTRMRVWIADGDKWFRFEELLYVLGRLIPGNLEEAESGVYSIYNAISEGNLRKFDFMSRGESEYVNSAGLFEVLFAAGTLESKAILKWIATEYLPTTLIQPPSLGPLPSLARIRRSRNHPNRTRKTA